MRATDKQYDQPVCQKGAERGVNIALGTDTSRSVAQISQNSEDGFLQDFLDPSIGFMRDLSESPRT